VRPRTGAIVLALTYQSKVRNRVYVRKFDHEEARLRHKYLDETYPQLAERYGVSESAIEHVINDTPERRERLKRNRHAWYIREGWKVQYDHCECGRWKRKVSATCRACYLREKFAEQVVAGRLLCLKCREYKDPDEFPRSRHRKAEHRFGLDSWCRDCSSKARNEHRHRRRIPCVRCGRPRSHPHDRGNKGDAHSDSGLCKDCFIEVHLVGRSPG
jgi:hypothetical protein